MQRLKSITKEADDLWDSLQTPEGREKWRIPSKGLSLLDKTHMSSSIMAMPSPTNINKHQCERSLARENLKKYKAEGNEVSGGDWRRKSGKKLEKAEKKNYEAHMKHNTIRVGYSITTNRY